MSGEKDNKAKTDTSSKRKALEEERKGSDKTRKRLIGFLSGDARVVTDSTPIVRQLMPRKVMLKNFVFDVDSVSQSQVELVVELSRGGVAKSSKIELEEGFNRVETDINVSEGAVVSIYLSHPGDFRVENITFAAEIINL